MMRLHSTAPASVRRLVIYIREIFVIEISNQVSFASGMLQVYTSVYYLDSPHPSFARLSHLLLSNAENILINGEPKYPRINSLPPLDSSTHLTLVRRSIAAGYVVLADFGFAKIVLDSTFTTCGSPEYMGKWVKQLI